MAQTEVVITLEVAVEDLVTEEEEGEEEEGVWVVATGEDLYIATQITPIIRLNTLRFVLLKYIICINW